MYGDLIRMVETLYRQAKADPHRDFPNAAMFDRLKRDDMLVGDVIVRVQVSWIHAPGTRPTVMISMSNQTNGDLPSTKLKLPEKVVDVVKTTIAINVRKYPGAVGEGNS